MSPGYATRYLQYFGLLEHVLDSERTAGRLYEDRNLQQKQYYLSMSNSRDYSTNIHATTVQ